MFGKDLANTNLFSDESKKYIDEIIEIKEIYEKNDINDLKNKISSLKKHDLKSSIDFIEKIKAIFEQEYKKRTFSVQNAKKSTFRGTQIYEAGTDFSIISKYIGVSDENIKTKWNNLCKIVENTKELRFYTCVLYMTPENILNEIKDDTVLLGFSQGLKNFSIDAIYEHDAHSKYTGVDQIYHDYESSNYVFPSTLEANTNNEYNEMVINTLYANNKGQNIKLQPDYVIYIKKEDEDEKENNSRWEKTKKVADSFGIPIVVIDRKLVRQSEKEKIEKMYKECTKNLKIESLERIIKKMDHYIARYNQNDIKNIYDSCKNLLKNQKEKKILQEKYENNQMTSNEIIDYLSNKKFEELNKEEQKFILDEINKKIKFEKNTNFDKKIMVVDGKISTTYIFNNKNYYFAKTGIFFDVLDTLEFNGTLSKFIKQINDMSASEFIDFIKNNKDLFSCDERIIDNLAYKENMVVIGDTLLSTSTTIKELFSKLDETIKINDKKQKIKKIKNYLSSNISDEEIVKIVDDTSLEEVSKIKKDMLLRKQKELLEEKKQLIEKNREMAENNQNLEEEGHLMSNGNVNLILISFLIIVILIIVFIITKNIYIN